MTTVHALIRLSLSIALVTGALAAAEAQANPPTAFSPPGHPALQPRLNPMPPVQPMPQYQLGAFGTFNGQGITIRQVYWNTPAARTGLEAGDTILRVNNQPIYSVQHFQALLNASGGYVMLLVQDVRTANLVQVGVQLMPVGGGLAGGNPWHTNPGPITQDTQTIMSFSPQVQSPPRAPVAPSRPMVPYYGR